MNYYSLNKKAPNVSFKDAVIKGLAPDKGLYFPENITPLPKAFFDKIDNLSHSEIAFEAIKQFVSPEIPEDILKTIIEETLSFDFPIVELNKNISELDYQMAVIVYKDTIYQAFEEVANLLTEKEHYFYQAMCTKNNLLMPKK